MFFNLTQASCLLSRYRLLSLLLVLPGFNAQAATATPASSASPKMEEMVVFGRGISLIGVANSASEGSVSGADLSVRPLLKVAELLEATPGMVAVQHSGSGKANQYFLRGFNLDHGTDYTASIDGVPLNFRSHGHGQGYLDINGLIPEVVASIDYQKGPYHAAVGDFSVAGNSTINTIDKLSQGFVSAEFGEYGWARLAGGESFEAEEGTLTLIAESKHYDGPWQQEEDLSHQSIWSKYLFDTDLGQAAFTLSWYQADWKPTEQIPERVIGSSVCSDEFCALDDSARGETNRAITSLTITNDRWQMGLYGQYYDWSMQSNPTYDFQINQFDKRSVVGGFTRVTLLQTEELKLTAGMDARHDRIAKVGLEQHEQGEFVDTISSNSIDESSLGSYVELAWQASEDLRVTSALRGDYYWFDVEAEAQGSFSGSEHDSALSPKFGVAYALADELEVYGNWGKGFHSNDARGVVNQDDAVPGISMADGYEAGVRSTIGAVNVSAAYWWLNQDSELIFVGDSNSVEPKGSSRREGYELVLFWQALPGVGVDASYAHSRARYDDNPEGEYVENAIETSAQLGVSVTHNAWEFNARVRHLGAYALTADNHHRAKPLTTVNFRTAYTWNSVTIYGEVINAFDSDDKDITYYYPAYIAAVDGPGLDADSMDCEAVDCRMSRVTEPRTLRAGVRYNF